MFIAEMQAQRLIAVVLRTPATVRARRREKGDQEEIGKLNMSTHKTTMYSIF